MSMASTEPQGYLRTGQNLRWPALEEGWVRGARGRIRVGGLLVWQRAGVRTEAA